MRYRELAAQNPKDTKLLIEAAEEAAWSGDPKKAIELLERGLQVDGKNDEILKRLVEFSFQTKDYARSAKYSELRDKLRKE